MAQEVFVSKYYQSVRDSGKFIDIDMACKIGVEFFLSSLLFKGDLKRVLYSKEDIAFRRRVELVGDGDVSSGKSFSYLNLDMPFAIYSQTGSYEEDDRGSTQSAKQIIKGFWDPVTGVLLKAAAVKIQYESTVFFSNLEDLSIAARLLYYEKTPAAPFYFIAETDLCGTPLGIPVNITIDSIDQNPQYNERDFLQKSRIFPLKVQMTIRSYMTAIEDVDNYMKLPLRYSGLYGYNDEKVVFTQKTSLIWADAKFTPHTHIGVSNGKATSSLDSVNKKTRVENGDMLYVGADGVETKLLHAGQPVREKIDNTIRDVVEGYFNESRDCTLVELRQDDDATTETEVQIVWKISADEVQNFKSITFYIPGICNDISYDSSKESYIFAGLNPGSEYPCSIVVSSNYGTKTTYELKLKTKGSSLLSDKLSDLLVGKTFAQL